MKGILKVVAIFAISFGSAVAASTQQGLVDLQDSLRSKRSYDQWLDVISQYARRGGDNANAFQPFPVDLPISGRDGKHTTLPILVLPIPVPVPGPDSKQGCNANNDRETPRDRDNSYKYNAEKYNDDRYRKDRYEEKYNEDKYRKDRYEEKYNEDKYRKDRYEEKYNEDRYRKDRYEEDTIRFKENNKQNNKDYGYDVRFGDSDYEKDYDNYEKKPSVRVTSDYLIEVFKRQQPTAPELPPAVVGYPPEITPPSIATVPRGFSGRQNLPPPERQYLPPSPPKFDRSMVVRGFLTVDRADYTEAYTAWYDARSGSARLEYHDAGTLTYRTMSPDGRVKRNVMTTDRSGDQDLVMCGGTAAGRASSEDREAPAIPNTDGFTFEGTKEEFGVKAEVWKREVRGGEGELGAARGEALVFRHELLVHRREDGFNVPLKYKVGVDSSVLGADCDGYEHIYSEVREKEHNEDEFRFNESQCDVMDKLDPSQAEDLARLEPIREFTLPVRDPRHDVNFESYIKQFERTYVDSKEEALRKNLLVQRTRFITSCNRQSNSFTVEVNFLSDRLNEEVEGILGVSFSLEFENNTASFPIKEDRVSDIERKLPKEFDWRPRGAVSSVKFQGVSCSSCWAFAVTGSVEGALFIKTKQFVELSVQSLVDCAVSHGAHGCNKIGTWPVHAYNYIKDRGIPANDEYTPYDAMDHKCKAPPSAPTTHIEGGVDVPPNNIEAMKVAIRRFAPTVVVVDAKPQSFISYKKGVLRDDRCIKGPKKKLNHAVLAVGWGEKRGAPHFIVKNSWSAAWGEGGYIRLHAPSNTCGHLTTPSFALLKRNNIDKLPGGSGRSAGRDDDDYDDRR